MRLSIAVPIIFLIPAFLLVNEEFSFENLALKSIKKSGDRTSARTKLNEIGLSSDFQYENFRLKQLSYSALLAFPTLFIFLFSEKSVSVIFLVITTEALSVFLFFEKSLDRKVSKHRNRIESDFPGVIEMMTLALSAGETPLSVLERVSSRGSGPLAEEFSKVIGDVRTGVPFSNSLDSMSRRVQSNTVRRFVDALVIAVNRGAPLIEVLHSHAREARDNQRNRVLEVAGKSEISMMIPVVFLILPISILFALWPSLSNLNLFTV
jgi:tight adherence protein C